MTNLEKFEEACKKIKKRDGINALLYNLQGRKRDPGVTLNNGYRSIGIKYLYFEHLKGSNQSVIFSWKQVTDVCVLAEIFVTTVVRKQYSGTK